VTASARRSAPAAPSTRAAGQAFAQQRHGKGKAGAAIAQPVLVKCDGVVIAPSGRFQGVEAGETVGGGGVKAGGLVDLVFKQVDFRQPFQNSRVRLQLGAQYLSLDFTGVVEQFPRLGKSSGQHGFGRCAHDIVDSG
jgi:hypothetical protein